MLTFHLELVEYNVDKLALLSDWTTSNWKFKKCISIKVQSCFNSENVTKIISLKNVSNKLCQHDYN